MEKEKNYTNCQNDNLETNAQQKCKRRRTVTVAGTAIFAAISVLLYITKVPPFVFPIFPLVNFLEINFSEIPALIAGFAYGPLSGFLVLLVRFLVKLPMSSTAMVGEVADIIYSSSFVLTATIIYKYRRTFKGALLGLGIAFIAQILVSSLANYFVIYHLYNEMFFNGKMAMILSNKYGAFTPEQFILWVIPFNIIKNTIIGGLTLVVYKRISRFINQFY
ncbi:MAG TPA: ECF transporter S component [Bacilli bacterium]|jgi:riboflavin transporter FmnP|nr:ECF transporter S component [Bacillota bacterium]NLI52241.1 ECF transporter S component [Erysipelotrichaceae bacterium]HOA11079.1 ECF transporter S component [Bacilli bacterium]TAH57395.1 MAG: ECF transporter S component [Bacillota bacterium]HOH95118.1 ECF transporter S component [Bacilli bacterium]